jgi:hypothetical protein
MLKIFYEIFIIILIVSTSCEIQQSSLWPRTISNYDNTVLHFVNISCEIKTKSSMLFGRSLVA